MRLIELRLPAALLLLLCSAAAAGAAVGRAWKEPPLPIRDRPETPAVPSRNPVPPPGIRGAPASPRPNTWTPLKPASTPPPPPNAEILRWERYLDHDDGTRAALARLPKYRRLITDALAARSMPMDFVYLPLIESEYRPSATSPVGAAGIWQLMPSTARAYGLEVSTWVDERRDPVRSTFAAVRHLHDLYVELGSWQLAAAAYNCGSRRVAAVARGSRSDIAYWRGRRRLPAETRAYLPKLIAAIRVGQRLSSDLSPAEPPLRFREVVVPGGVALADVAEHYGLAPDTVLALNPHLVRKITPPGRSWPVRIPPIPR